ncbi:MAG TPA: type II secretion system F family protein [Candidatus Saccharimonadales bacterium]|nr:type II secretion system F family protein [Candidatus Saccharimonadales bacterium]
MKYSYRALKDGKQIDGTVEGVSKEAVMSSLLHQGVHPVSLKEMTGSGKKGFSLSFGKPKVKLQDLVIFTRQLSTMISAGVPLTRSLSTLGAECESPVLKQAIQGVVKDVEGGAPLGDSFAKYPHIFSEVYVNMVRAGEEGGILDEILKRLALQVELDASIRKKVKSAMAYPMVLMVVTVLAFFGIMLGVLPRIGKILTDMGGPDAKLPVYTQVLLDMSAFMINNAVIIGILLAGTIFAIRRYIRTPKGKYNFHALLLRIPVLKNIVMKMAVARFARTFASLMSAGVSVLDALEVTAGAIGNKVFERDLKEAATQVRNGKQLSEPIGKSGNWPPIVAQMLAVGEETGQIDTVLIKVADFYEEEVGTLIDGLASVIEPVMIVVLGGAVGMIAASVMGPIANLSKSM